MRIEVGYGLEGQIPDAAAARIIRSFMTPALKRGDYDLAVESACMRAPPNRRTVHDTNRAA